MAVFLVTVGVILATTSRPLPSVDTSNNADHATEYAIGVLMLTFSLFLTGVLGMLQEKTYTKYGPCWREGVFYTVSPFSIKTLEAIADNCTR